VSEGLGYGILPERAVRMLGAPLNRVKGLPFYRDEICLVWRPEFGKTDFEKFVIESLKQSFADEGVLG
jgi:DNA-binding transcriptional LysR family regulator